STIKTARKITANELKTSINSISRLNIWMVFFPLAKLIRNKNAMAKVVVRIPPPAELGEAPMNISALIKTFVASLNWVMSTVTIPPEREETEWNIAANAASCQLIPLNARNDSSSKMPAAPTANKIAKMLVVILVKREK